MADPEKRFKRLSRAEIQKKVDQARPRVDAINAEFDKMKLFLDKKKKEKPEGIK